jgi:predicted dehydrogenase
VTPRVYRAAIVGCGRKAATLDDEERCRINYSIPPDAHAAAYQQAPSAQLVAAADPNESKRRLIQARWGVPTLYADYREMLAHERPDLVSVTTRAPLHAEVTIAAAASGAKGVLCEKAMATSLREADMMIEACQRAGTVLVINYTRRWHPTYERALQCVRDGTLGTVRAIVGTCPQPLVHNGTHLFDLMHMFGGPVAWVTGQVAGDGSQDQPGRAMLRFASGAAGFADVDSAVGFGLEIQGTAGRLFIDPAEEGLTLWTYADPPPPTDSRAWYQGGPCKQRTVRHLTGDGTMGTLVAAIRELIMCIQRGGQSRSSGHGGRTALELALAVYASHGAGGARTGLPLRDREFAVISR